MMRNLRILLATCALAMAVVSVPGTPASANGGPEFIVLGGPGAVSEEIADYLETCTTADVTRISGSDRYATAAAFATWAGFPEGGIVFLATGTNFPDALAVGPRASDEGGPILLTAPDALPAATISALNKLKPSNTVIVGGTGAISSGVENQLEAGNYGEVVRIAGSDRYATAAAVEASSSLTGGTVFIATGENYPDALAGSHAAAASGSPILLVTSDRIPTATRDVLQARGPSEIVILGGEAVVSASVANELGQYAPTVRRLAGANRFDTARAISEDTYPSGAAKVFIATGENYPDALAAGVVLSPFVDGPILLTTRDRLPRETATELARFSYETCKAFDAARGDFGFEISGYGDDVVAVSTPRSEAGVIQFTHSGSSNFAVWALDGSLSKQDLLVNEIGSYHGTRPVNTDSFFWPDPMRYLDVTADGYWQAHVLSISLTRQLTSTLSGTSDDVIRLSKTGVVNFKYNGVSNFAVWARGNDDADLLVNTIGNYSGNQVVPSWAEYLDITGIGDWTIRYP